MNKVFGSIICLSLLTACASKKPDELIDKKTVGVLYRDYRRNSPACAKTTYYYHRQFW